MRNFRNVQSSRQKELEARFWWLPKVHEMALVAGVEKVSISVFDHWLSQEEAEQQLAEVSSEVQAKKGRIAVRSRPSAESGAWSSRVCVPRSPKTPAPLSHMGSARLRRDAIEAKEPIGNSAARRNPLRGPR